MSDNIATKRKYNTGHVVWKYEDGQGINLIEALTAREIEILRLTANGLDDNEIGDLLCISPRTVRQHVCVLMKKMGVHRRILAVRMGIALGLVDLAEYSPNVALTLDQILNLIAYYSQLARQYAKEPQP